MGAWSLRNHEDGDYGKNTCRSTGSVVGWSGPMSKASVIRVFRRSLLVILCGWLLLWCIGSLVLRGVISWMEPRVEEKARQIGVEMEHISYSGVRLSPWLNAVHLREVSLDFDLAPNDQHRLSSSFQCESIRIKLSDLLAMRGQVILDDFEVKLHSSDRPAMMPFDRFDDGYVYLGDVPLLDPRQVFQQLVDGVVDIFDDNESRGAFEFSGVVQIRLGGKTHPARMFTERKGEAFRLRFSKQDIRSLSDRMNFGLAEEQVEVVSYYPLRAPVIASITGKAKRISLSYFSGDIWKQDALRHIVWSYMLTETFGPDFAKKVTDAQEQKPGNEYDERLMDYNNNAVGRMLVAEKVSLNQVPGRVVSDPRVVLSPEAAQIRGGARLFK